MLLTRAFSKGEAKNSSFGTNQISQLDFTYKQEIRLNIQLTNINVKQREHLLNPTAIVD